MGNCLSSTPQAEKGGSGKPAKGAAAGDVVKGGASEGVPLKTTEVVVAPTSVLAMQYFLFSRLPDPQGVAVRAGATWIARERANGQMAVLRVLQLPLEPGLVPLVCREVEALAPALLNSHPNVMTAKSLVLTAEHLALIMDAPFTDNKLLTLDVHTGVSKKMPNKPGLNIAEPTALHFFTQMLDAMGYFHAKRLAHLGMDLANMVVDRSQNPPVIKLLDRGFSKSWRVANDLTYCRKQWSSGSKKYGNLCDSINDLNRSVKAERVAGSSGRGGTAYTDINGSQTGDAPSLNSSLRGARGMCGPNSGKNGNAVHDVGNSMKDHRPSLTISSREDSTLSGNDRGNPSPSASEKDWELDAVFGCSFASAQAVDVFSCGCCLFALLMGTYPQSILQRQIDAKPWEAAEIISFQMMLGWQDFPAVHKRFAGLSAECQDLLQRMLSAEESERITLSDIKSHPWVTSGPQPDYRSPMDDIGRRRSIGNAAKTMAVPKQSADFMSDLKKKISETVWNAANMDSGLSTKEMRSIAIGQPFGISLEEALSRCLSHIPEASSFSSLTSMYATPLKTSSTDSGPKTMPLKVATQPAQQPIVA